MPLGLIALALGGFGIGLNEFVVTGLLPSMATDFAVSPSTAGWIVTGYAFSVAIGAVAITSLVGHLPRKPVLLGLVVLFIIGNVICAMAPTFPIMLIGRVVAAMCQGAYYGIGAVVAGSLVAPNKKAYAIAIMFTGLTVANVLGVPMGTFIGLEYGWRATFWAISGIGVLAFGGIALAIPYQARSGGEGLRSELAVFKSAQVWLSLALTALTYGGLFGSFAYISYVLTDVSGFSSGTVPWLLVLLGIALFIGNLLGGKAADKALDKTLTFLLVAIIIILVAFSLVASNPVAAVIALILMGGFGFGTIPGLQMRVIKYAHDESALVSGANIGAFNLGIGFGAWLGGVTIAAGLGYTSSIWSGAPVVGLGLLALIYARILGRRTRTSPSRLVKVASSDGTAPTPTSDASVVTRSNDS
ncbi:MFS transporter [Streptomyces sp. NPDC056653]|uniref:MFS transporter n=1 Tax=Streptomyces sp. NPDC056653 TaxID=3345894 RepID=UPI0036BCB20B